MGNKTRIATIEESNSVRLQKSVNEYLAEMKEDIVDISYLQSFHISAGGEKYPALIAIIRYIDD